LEIQQGVLVRGGQSKGWSACKTWMLLKEVGAKARGVRALMAQAYSPTCLKVRLHPKQCGRGENWRGASRREFTKGVQIGERVVASAYP
jgi:hypothetical protein